MKLIPERIEIYLDERYARGLGKRNGFAVSDWELAKGEVLRQDKWTQRHKKLRMLASIDGYTNEDIIDAQRHARLHVLRIRRSRRIRMQAIEAFKAMRQAKQEKALYNTQFIISATFASGRYR